MAGSTGLRFARHGQSDSGHVDLDHHVYDYYAAHGPVWTLLDQSDVYDEFYYADAHRAGFCLSRLLDREIPIPEHVRATASRTSAQRTPD